MTIVKLGLVQALVSSTTAPTNIKCLWYDENVSLHKFYNTTSSTWELIRQQSQYKGVAVVATPTPSSPLTGDFWNVGEAGTVFGVALCTIGDQVWYNGSAWELLDLT